MNENATHDMSHGGEHILLYLRNQASDATISIQKGTKRAK